MSKKKSVLNRTPVSFDNFARKVQSELTKRNNGVSIPKTEAIEKLTEFAKPGFFKWLKEKK